MSEEKVAAIAARFHTSHLARGEHLLVAGEVNDRYLVVASGWLRSFTYDARGDEVTTGFTGPGQVVLDADSFFMRTPAKESIIALSDVAGHELSFQELNALFHEVAEFREMGRAILVRMLVGLKQRMLSMINLTAEERYALLVRTRPELFQHASLKHIASFLGVTGTSLSRIRKEFVTA